jgi:hypothetical protein
VQCCQGPCRRCPSRNAPRDGHRSAPRELVHRSDGKRRKCGATNLARGWWPTERDATTLRPRTALNHLRQDVGIKAPEDSKREPPQTYAKRRSPRRSMSRRAARWLGARPVRDAGRARHAAVDEPATPATSRACVRRRARLPVRRSRPRRPRDGARLCRDAPARAARRVEVRLDEWAGLRERSGSAVERRTTATSSASPDTRQPRALPDGMEAVAQMGPKSLGT